jgi:hypothetical protein
MKALAFAVLLAGALLLGAEASPAGARKAPRVWVADRSPIVVVGSGFASRERVSVTLVAGGKRLAKTLRSNRAGGVRAQWPGSVTIDACHFVVVTAVAADGRRASYKSPRGGVECTPVQPIDQ